MLKVTKTRCKSRRATRTPPCATGAGSAHLRSGRTLFRGSLSLVFLALTLEFVGCGAQGFGNVFVGAKFLEVERVEHGQHVQGDIQGRFGIVRQVAHDDVIFAEVAVLGDETQDFVGKAGHGREGLHFLVGQTRRL